MAHRENAVAELQRQLVGSPIKGNWWERVIGTIADEAAFLEALEFGRALREADADVEDEDAQVEITPSASSSCDAQLAEAAEVPQSAPELFAAIRDSGLIGMWKRRKDIPGSAAFARELRQRAQELQW